MIEDPLLLFFQIFLGTLVAMFLVFCLRGIFSAGRDEARDFYRALEPKPDSDDEEGGLNG